MRANCAEAEMPIYRPLAEGFTLLAGLLIAAAAQAAPSCELHMVASLPATLSAHNQLLVDVAINDEPAKIQIDTGASTSLLSEKFAARMGLPIENMPGVVYGLTGRALDSKTHVQRLRLGNTISSNADFVLMPLGGDGTDGGPIGLFGADYLQNYDVEIDVAAGWVKLFSQDHCPGKVVYWAQDYFKTPIYYPGKGALHRPALDIAVEGRTVRALIDTGAFMTVMRMATARDRFGLSPASSDMQKRAQTGGVDGRKLDTYLHTFQSLTFGDITLHNTLMAITPIDSAAHVATTGSHLNLSRADEPDVLIGMSLLKHLHILIAYSENALYYTIAPTKQAATP
jgi:predicted aspartyl protease